MTRWLIPLTLLPLAFLGVGLCGAAEAPRPLPPDLAPHFTPPAQLADDGGQYRPPLLGEDGKRVTDAAGWRRRREEILRTWHELMGPWPPLIEKPRVEPLGSDRRESFTQRRVRVEIAPGRTTDGYLLVPDGKGPFPAVLTVYYEPETAIGVGKAELRDFAYQLAKRGFVALSIGGPGGGAYYPDEKMAQLQPLSYMAYVAANCYNALAAQPEVDPKRVGVVGHSYGGKWAMFASCLYEKFACGVWSDPGVVFDEKRPNVNYWEPWYLGWEAGTKRKPGVPTAENPRTGPYKKMMETGRDLHELHALMAPRPFLVSGGSEDRPERWKPLTHAIAVNRLLGYDNRVAMTNRPAHGPTEESNKQIYRFFEHFLKEQR